MEHILFDIIYHNCGSSWKSVAMSAQFNIIIITKGKQRCDTLRVFFYFYHKMLRYAELILTPHCVPRSHQLKIHSHLEFIFTAYRVPRSQPFS